MLLGRALSHQGVLQYGLDKGKTAVLKHHRHQMNIFSTPFMSKLEIEEDELYQDQDTSMSSLVYNWDMDSWTRCSAF